jgi:diacylglycerol kinase (ATP)
MVTVAIVAHRKKGRLIGGLGELRRILDEYGVVDPIWIEVDKSREASRAAQRAVDEGANLIFVWGGDGTVQRCVHALAGQPVEIAILPAGTANLLATNLQIPTNLFDAVDVGLHGARRKLDVGMLENQRFAVMAGVGLDAIMMKRANGRLKNRLGRLAYVWTGLRASRMAPLQVRVMVDDVVWFEGAAVSVLLGQLGNLGSGLIAFPDALADDGLLEVGVVKSGGLVALTRVLMRVVHGHPERSPFTEMTQGREIEISLDRATPYQVDGSARKARHQLRATVVPGAITVCVPWETQQH